MLKQKASNLSEREGQALQLGVVRLSQSLGIIAALVLPFLAVLAAGIILDKKTGGDPFYATTFYLFFLSPLWLLLGIFVASRARRNGRVRRWVCVADGILVAFLIVGIAIVRSINAR